MMLSLGRTPARWGDMNLSREIFLRSLSIVFGETPLSFGIDDEPSAFSSFSSSFLCFSSSFFRRSFSFFCRFASSFSRFSCSFFSFSSRFFSAFASFTGSAGSSPFPSALWLSSPSEWMPSAWPSASSCHYKTCIRSHQKIWCTCA